MKRRERQQQAQNDFIESLPENFSILEEPIDIIVQQEYFEFSQEIDGLLDSDQLKETVLGLQQEELASHRTHLIRLARTNNVDAYYAIVAYREKCANKKMKAWATLAMQESRMAIESDLLDDSHLVFVSTGLGGKGQNIRFFMVAILRDLTAEYTPMQKKLLRTELSFQISSNGGEVEKIRFAESYAICTFLYPLKNPLQELLFNVVNECNQYGDFLREELLCTNIKKLSLKEIRVHVQARDTEEPLDADETAG